MKKLRIGVWLQENYKAASGGGFGYYNQLLKRLNNYNFKDAEIIFLSGCNGIDSAGLKNVYHLKWRPLKKTLQTRTIDFVSRKLGISVTQKPGQHEIYHNNKVKLELREQVDVIYYLIPGCAFPNFPYIYTLWDLGHLSTYAFPELSMHNGFEIRKLTHDLEPYKAVMIFTESNSGKKELVRYLQINEQRIKVIPIFPSEIVSDNLLPQKPEAIDPKLFFIHYPAQYWAHKNHFNLLIAFEQIIKQYPSLKMVFTGYDKGNRSYIMQLIKEHHLEGHVIDLGFVSNEELKWLYVNSQGLVMPTFLGPTNMPLLEAAELNCPVACSKLEGHIELLDEYGYYFDPLNPLDIANTICRMLADKINNIKRSYQSNFNIDNALLSIDNSFSELKQIRFCWGADDRIF